MLGLDRKLLQIIFPFIYISIHLYLVYCDFVIAYTSVIRFCLPNLFHSETRENLIMLRSQYVEYHLPFQCCLLK